MWTLILYIYAGAMSSGDSVALTNVPNFVSQAACETAGKQADSLVARSAKNVRFVCVKDK